MPLPRVTARAAHAGASVVLALAWAGFLAAAHLEGRATLLDRIEAPLLDLRFLVAGPRPAPPDLVIVAVDDDTVRDIGTHPLPRATMARLVGEVARHAPRAVGLDILFLDSGPAGDDLALAGALRDAGAVIAAAALFSRASPAASPRDVFTDLPIAERILMPTERLRQGAGIGLVNITTDAGGTPRHIPFLVRAGDTLVPSLPLRVATRAAGSEPVIRPGAVIIGAVETRLDLGLTLPLRFYGARGAIPTVSAGAVLRGETRPEALRGKIVVIGATAIGTGDTFATPYDPVLPGVEVLTTATAHLLTGDGLVRDMTVRRVDAAAAVILALGAALLLSFAPSALGIGLVALAGAVWVVVTAMAFGRNVWLSATLPLAAMALPIVFGIAGRQILDRRFTRNLASAEKALRGFHSPALAARLALDPAFLTEPVAQKLSIVFVDLSGFTRLSESLGPAATQVFLKGFHALVEEEVSRHGGVVMSFMGDGAMSVFGLPDPGPKDADHALAAASGLVPRIRQWLAERSDRGCESIDLRVGAHHGDVVVSRLGASDHQHITATGDSVNVASRLLEVAKELGMALVVSEDLLAALKHDRPEHSSFEGRRAIAIRGRRRPLRVAYGWPCPARPAADHAGLGRVP